MPEQNTNEQKPNLIAEVAKHVKIDTSGIFKKIEEHQKGVNNSMNGLGMDDQKLDKGMDI
jgi:hypothetical protein